MLAQAVLWLKMSALERSQALFFGTIGRMLRRHLRKEQELGPPLTEVKVFFSRELRTRSCFWDKAGTASQSSAMQPLRHFQSHDPKGTGYCLSLDLALTCMALILEACRMQSFGVI